MSHGKLLTGQGRAHKWLAKVLIHWSSASSFKINSCFSEVTSQDTVKRNVYLFHTAAKQTSCHCLKCCCFQAEQALKENEPITILFMKDYKKSLSWLVCSPRQLLCMMWSKESWLSDELSLLQISVYSACGVPVGHWYGIAFQVNPSSKCSPQALVHHKTSSVLFFPFQCIWDFQSTPLICSVILWAKSLPIIHHLPQLSAKVHNGWGIWNPFQNLI